MVVVQEATNVVAVDAAITLSSPLLWRAWWYHPLGTKSSSPGRCTTSIRRMSTPRLFTSRASGVVAASLTRRRCAAGMRTHLRRPRGAASVRAHSGSA